MYMWGSGCVSYLSVWVGWLISVVMFARKRETLMLCRDGEKNGACLGLEKQMDEEEEDPGSDCLGQMMKKKVEEKRKRRRKEKKETGGKERKGKIICDKSGEVMVKRVVYALLG